MARRSLLFIVSIASIVLFFTIPLNATWFYKRVVASIHNFSIERDHMDLDERRTYKYRDTYVILQQAANFLNTNNAVNPIVLLPPNAYLKSQHMDIRMPEPVVFYYYIGLRAVWTDSPDVESANWALVAKDGKVHLVRLENKDQLHQLLSFYKNYPPAL
jgi:hypothetical protein